MVNLRHRNVVWLIPGQMIINVRVGNRTQNSWLLVWPCDVVYKAHSRKSFPTMLHLQNMHELEDTHKKEAEQLSRGERLWVPQKEQCASCSCPRCGYSDLVKRTKGDSRLSKDLARYLWVKLYNGFILSIEKREGSGRQCPVRQSIVFWEAGLKYLPLGHNLVERVSLDFPANH